MYMWLYVYVIDCNCIYPYDSICTLNTKASNHLSRKRCSLRPMTNRASGGSPDRPRPDWSWPSEMDEKWWEWAYGYGLKLVNPQTDGLIMFNPPTIGGVMRHRASIRIGTKQFWPIWEFSRVTTTWNSNQLGRMQIGLRLQLCWADQKQTWLTSWVCMCLYIENHWGIRSLISILFICHTAQQKNCKSMKVLVATIRGSRSHWSACARGTCRQCQAHGSSMVILLVPPDPPGHLHPNATAQWW